MSVDAILTFIVSYSVYIIQVVALCLLGLVGFVVYREIVKSPEETGHGASYGGQLGELEETLKKVLEQTKGQSFSIPVGEGGAVDQAALEAARLEAQQAVQREIESLKQQISEKDQQMKDLASQTESSSGPDPELMNQIQDLEARLAEYEIIEDDIADLSIYKEENARLKEEIASLKSGGATPSEPSATESDPVAEEAEAPAAGDVSPEELAEAEAIANAAADVADDMADLDDGDSVDAVAAEEPKSNTAEEVDAIMDSAMLNMDGVAPVEEPVAESEDSPSTAGKEDPSAVVDSAVAEALADGDLADMMGRPPEPPDDDQGQEEVPVATADPEASVEPEAPAPEESAVVEEKAAESAVTEPVHDDILAEFVAGSGAESSALDEESVKEFVEGSTEVEKSEDSDSASVAEIDTSKMMEEMAALNEVAGDADGSAALEEAMDVEKMAAEASALGGDN